MSRQTGRPRVLDDAAIQNILDWYRHHRTLKQVAAQHGVSPNTVRRVIRQHFGRFSSRGAGETGGPSGGEP
jgi:AraC-like DNA-binding protein